MKLSEMTTDKAADALVRLAEPAAEIVNDDKVFELIKGAGKVANAGFSAQMAFILREVAPVLLKDHRGALYEVLSILTGKKAADIFHDNRLLVQAGNQIIHFLHICVFRLLTDDNFT